MGCLHCVLNNVVDAVLDGSLCAICNLVTFQEAHTFSQMHLENGYDAFHEKTNHGMDSGKKTLNFA